MKTLIAALLALTSMSSLTADWTLYRNSSTEDGESMRIPIASFDTKERSMFGDYNLDNCNLVANLMQKQPGVIVRYWCEPKR